MKTIDELTTELLEQVLDLYYNQPAETAQPLSFFIDEALAKYNDAVADLLSESIGAELAKTFTRTVPTVVPTAVALSDLLYNNSALVSSQTTQLLSTAGEVGTTAQDLALQLYEGYDFNDKEVLDIVDKLPNYLTEFLDGGNLDDFLDVANNLKTKPLKVATKAIIDALEKANEKALHDALAVVLEEKARYYADRIAKTEIQRAKELANAKDMMLDPNIKFVKWQLSSRHRIFDICDLYANMDMGYGAGIYPVGQSPAIPLHPFCMCKVVPHYHNPTQKDKPNPIDDFMDKLTPHQQRDIAGSWDKLGEYLNGTPLLDILNTARPKYPIVPIAQVLEDLMQNPFPKK